MWIVTAFIAPADVQAVSYGSTASEALDRWQSWITNGEPLESLSDEQASWISAAKSAMRNYGLSPKQDSGCHYRLETLYP